LRAEVAFGGATLDFIGIFPHFIKDKPKTSLRYVKARPPGRRARNSQKRDNVL
jgi:hypothetical protein